jgi:1-deoxy-D-xylulose-5-phosphate synthase
MSEKILENINSPADIKRLTIQQLTELAEEIRQFIIDTISKSGGHLSSNLGVIELTLALHCVFDFKTDRLLFDVGHQCYTHKIITGRKDGFAKLRTAGGVSGFPNPAESPYDCFTVGHAGTSIATAIGLALGKQLAGKDKENSQNNQDKIVAIIGDASIVNGTSFEALNNLDLVKRQLLIVLNDNSMAIDATVGAVAQYFSKFRLSQTYEDLRKSTSSILEHMPLIGKSVEDAIERFKKSIRMALPPSQLFESLHIPYFGPVDGHDIDSLIQLFETLAELNHPVILHVYTNKGRGFAPVNLEPSKLHSTGPFKINGDSMEHTDKPALPSFTESFGRHLSELAENDEKIVAITSAMCDGTGLGDFSQKFPQRFFDVGIAEEAAVDIAAGLAKNGYKPFVCIYSTFIQRSFDHIFQEVCLQNLPVVFCIDRAGFVGSDGPTHHGLMDIGFFRMLPNVVLTAPANDNEMRLAMEFALESKNPVVIRYPKEVVSEDPIIIKATKKPFQLGKSVQISGSPDSKLAIISYGSILTEARKATELLKKENITVDVINARFAAPLDDKFVWYLKEGKAIITLEDHSVACGFGSAVLELAVAWNCQVNNIRLFGASAKFYAHDSRYKQICSAGLNAENIAKTAQEMLNSQIINV